MNCKYNLDCISKVEIVLGIILIFVVLILFNDYNLPIEKQFIKEVIGQTIVFFTGVFLVIIGLFDSKKEEIK